MFGKIRRLEISLAAKCQILFGAAVLLIIAAALLVPWRRMEQLTAQLDERAAAVLADDAVARHVNRDLSLDAMNQAGSGPSTQPALDEDVDESRPAEAMKSELATKLPKSRVVGLGPDAPLTRFERKTLVHFLRHPEGPPQFAYYDRGNVSDGYRYARPLHFNESCTRCHALNSDGLLVFASEPATEPATAPTTTATVAPPARASATTHPSRGPLVGMISVDMGSRIDANVLP